MVASKRRVARGVLIKRYLKLLAANPDVFANHKILEGIPEDAINTIADTAANVTHGNIKLSQKQKRVLRKYKSPISALLDKKKSNKQKKRIILQNGGGFFVPFLLSTALSALPSILNVLTQKLKPAE